MISSTSPSRVKRDYLSYSAIRTFQACPLKYKFRYIDELPEECISASLVFGIAIHAAVEFYFRQLLAGDETPDQQQLHATYLHHWQCRAIDKLRFGKHEDADGLHKLADRMLAAFLASDAAQTSGRIVGVEEELRGSLLPELPDLLGRVDLLVETDEAVVIQDFKTSRSAWSQQQIDNQSEQLLLYGDLVRRLIPGKTLRLQFAVISKTRHPKVQVLETEFDENKLDRTKRVIESVWSAIQAGNFYPAPSPTEKNHPQEAAKALAFYKLLYEVETRSQLIDSLDLLQTRRREAVPIWTAFDQWMQSDAVQGVLPKSQLGKALTYMRNHELALKRYLYDARLPIDNNQSEQTIRPFVIGRRNWTFLGHPHAAPGRLKLFSIASSAHRHGLLMQDYFEDILKQLAYAGQHAPELLQPGSDYLQALLPDQWAQAHPASVSHERRQEREVVSENKRIRFLRRQLAGAEKRQSQSASSDQTHAG